MTTHGMWGVGAWVVAGGVALAISAFAPVVTLTPPAVLRRPSAPFAALSPYPVDSLGRVAVSRDVFRSARRAASVTYDAQRAVAPVEASQPPKPVLALLGLVAGARPPRGGWGGPGGGGGPAG